MIPGDGTGPEVTVEAIKVLKAAADRFDFKVDLTGYDFGGESNVLSLGAQQRGMDTDEVLCWWSGFNSHTLPIGNNG